MYTLNDYYLKYNNPNDPISEINSTQRLVETFFELGLVESVDAPICDTLKRVVFLIGNKNEVYSQPEIEFINSFSMISVYNESIYSRKNRITTRLVVSEINEINPIRSCIIFTQLLNKALQGFNVVFFITQIGIIVSIPIMGEETHKNYQLSRPICSYVDLEEMCNNIVLAPNRGRFVEYYLYMKAITSPLEDETVFEEKLHLFNRGPNYQYLAKLREVGDLLRIDLTKEIQNYLEFYDNEPERPRSFESIVEEEDAYVFPIVSNPLNTMELRLSSEELNQLHDIEEAEDDISNNNTIDEDLEMSLLKIKDPEELIKQLKKKYGI